MLVFSAVIVSLTLVALAAPDVKTYNLKFKGEEPFCVDEATGSFIPCREEGDLLNVSHLGLCDVYYEISLEATGDPPSHGPFTITGANGDSLEGYYSDFSLDEDGVYMLEWTFTSGSGRFEGAEGIGYTDGLADLSVLPPYAVFEFYGEITVPKNKGKK